MCNMSRTEDIEHLIYSCQYAQAIWKEIECVFNMEISIENVLFGKDITKDLNTVFSIICHLIYKEWLELSLEGKERTCVTGLKSIKHDLLFHRDVYKGHYKWLGVTLLLSELCGYIMAL